MSQSSQVGSQAVRGRTQRWAIGHGDADDAYESEDVGDERVAEVAGADEDVDGDVVVDGEQGGDEEEDDHRGHDAEVHHARVGVAKDALGAAAALDEASKSDGQVVEGGA